MSEIGDCIVRSENWTVMKDLSYDDSQYMHFVLLNEYKIRSKWDCNEQKVQFVLGKCNHVRVPSIQFQYSTKVQIPTK